MSLRANKRRVQARIRSKVGGAEERDATLSTRGTNQGQNESEDASRKEKIILSMRGLCKTERFTNVHARPYVSSFSKIRGSMRCLIERVLATRTPYLNLTQHVHRDDALSSGVNKLFEMITSDSRITILT